MEICLCLWYILLVIVLNSLGVLEKGVHYGKKRINL